MKYNDQQYITYDPFAGDRDTDVKCRTVKLVKVRKVRKCCEPREPHDIKIGEHARCERAIVDGNWRSYYCCIPCMDKWFEECGLEPNRQPL